MPSIAATPQDVVVEAGPVARFGSEAGTGVQLWIREPVGGDRIVEVPSSVFHAPEWTDTHGAPTAASCEIERYATQTPGGTDYWIALIEEWKCELELVVDGETRVWGPVQVVPEPLGADRARVEWTDPSAYFGARVMRADDNLMVKEWVSNHRFDGGLSHWTTMGGTLDGTRFEEGSQSVKVDAGESLQQEFHLGVSAPRLDARVRLRVWVEAAVTTAVFHLERDQLSQTIRGTASVSSSTPRDQWTWLTIDARVVNTNVALGAMLTIRLDTVAGGTVWVDRGSCVVRPESIGEPGVSRRVPIFTASLAAASLVAVGGEGKNIGVLTDPLTEGGPISAIWQTRGDMPVSECLRALSDLDDGLEFRWLYSSTSRILEAKQLVGVEHDPAALRLRPVPGSGAGTKGNEVSSEGRGGVGRPTTRVIARSEDGFTDQAEDMSEWGTVYEEVIQAPMGVLDLSGLALARLRASATDTRAWRVKLTDKELIGTLRLGDRVQMTYSDGPSVFDDLVRIEQVTYRPGQATPVELVVSVWVDPGSAVKMPRPAKARTWQSTDTELVSLGRRTFDLERRVATSTGVERFDELNDVAAVDDDAPDDGDVPIWDSARERWVPGPGGGGAGGYATARASGDTTPDSWLDWSEASDPAWEPTLYAGGLVTNEVGGIVVAEPGFYDVAVVGVSDDAFTIEAFSDSAAGGWQWASEADEVPPFCRSNLKIMEGADAGDGGASGSIQMALPADHRVLVRIVTAGFVEWSLSLELVAPADIVDGSCGS